MLTGHILKDPEANYRAENIVEIDASIEGVERVIRTAGGPPA